VLRRTIDQQPAIVYTFPPNTMIRSGERLTLWASGHRSPPDSLVFGAIQTWGDGRTVVTTLEENGQVRARYTRTCVEEEKTVHHHSATVVVGNSGLVKMNGSSSSADYQRELTHSTTKYVHESSHNSAIETNHVSGSEYDSGQLHASHQQSKIVTTGGDEFDFLDDHQNGGASLDNHEVLTTSSRTMEASSFAAGGGNTGEIASVTSLVGKFEQGGQQQQQHTHKTYKFRRDQKTWDHGESNN